MTQFTPFSAAIGGSLIALATVLLLKFNGRVAGISGILGNAFTGPKDDRGWRVSFVVGLAAGGLLYQTLSGEPLMTREDFSLPLLAGAGFLVGLGTRIGHGCTSGHGICGLARLSMRSLIATVVFLLTGMVTATSLFLLRGGAS